MVGCLSRRRPIQRAHTRHGCIAKLHGRITENTRLYFRKSSQSYCEIRSGVFQKRTGSYSRTARARTVLTTLRYVFQKPNGCIFKTARLYYRNRTVVFPKFAQSYCEIRTVIFSKHGRVIFTVGIPKKRLVSFTFTFWNGTTSGADVVREDILLLRSYVLPQPIIAQHSF